MKIFYGAKGSGKTKAVIDFANNAKTSAKGHVVFITDTDRYGFDLKLPIRFVNSAEFGVFTEDEVIGFIKGIVASNGDNEYILIDGLARICGKNLADDTFRKAGKGGTKEGSELLPFRVGED